MKILDSMFLFKLTMVVIIVMLAFSLSYAVEEVTLSWTPPTTNENGTALTDLAGYKVHYGTDMNNLNNSIDVGDVTSYSLINLLPDTGYYVAVTAYDISDNESLYSNKIGVTTFPAPDTDAPSGVNIEVTCKVDGQPVDCKFIL